jgi:very-short-patch-repair endonuclease
MGTQAAARRRALARRERELIALAERQHGVLARRQLLEAGLAPRTIRRRVEAGRLCLVHREVYAFGRERLTQRGKWLAAVLACGGGAVLSHRSAAALYGLMEWRLSEVTAPRGRQRQGIATHECGLHRDERTSVDRIPITTVARVLLDLAEVIDERELKRTVEEADRRCLLDLQALEVVYTRGLGRRGLKPFRRVIEETRLPNSQSPLEDRVLELCRDYDLPMPRTNCKVLGREVDAFWPDEKLMVEADSFEFHAHRAAFERDRARDAAMQVAGYRVVRLTHRRLKEEPTKVATELRHLLAQGRAAA